MTKRPLGPGDRPFRLARVRNIPKGWQSRVDLAHSLARQIVVGREHFSRNSDHYRDGPARRRFQDCRQRLSEILDMLCAHNPIEGQRVRRDIESILTHEGATHGEASIEHEDTRQ